VSRHDPQRARDNCRVETVRRLRQALHAKAMQLTLLLGILQVAGLSIEVGMAKPPHRIPSRPPYGHGAGPMDQGRGAGIDDEGRDEGSSLTGAPFRCRSVAQSCSALVGTQLAGIATSRPLSRAREGQTRSTSKEYPSLVVEVVFQFALLEISRRNSGTENSKAPEASCPSF
jgi:hypothetical protein